ncbi:MAG TPA: excinuclease ABC subunit UvrC [Candidatus Sumerlaeota bacterium]|nr:excinuclease ABC subunit UvrC [Candidatus Sumerlaeota bacterium]
MSPSPELPPPSDDPPPPAGIGADAAAPADAGPDPADPPVIPGKGITPEEIDRIPALPGVYIMRDAAGKAIYIGKAANLRARVGSYFKRSGDARFNVQFLMRHVQRVETIITANEKEAFLLENTLIKKHQPRYNLRLRDDKTYVSVRINLDHEWPRAVVMRRRAEARRDKAVYLGPYASAHGVRETLRQLQRVFPIRSCTDHVLRNRTRPCLLHAIGRCCAPCVKPVDKDEYRELVEGTILFLKGKTREVVRMLQERMARHAEAMEFEQAAVVRDRLRAIEATTERQAVHQHEGSDRDVIVLERRGGYGAFVVFVYRNGLLVSSRPFLVRDHERPGEDLMEEFIARYYELEAPPRELVVDPAPRGAGFLESWLAERRDARVQIVAPQRGEKLRLVETARENANRLLEQHLSGQKTIEEIHREIREKFHLEATPDPIECFDISTIQGFATVGSMVTFRGGEPDKARYRRFRIKSLTGQDDFGALNEMLTRRFRRVAEGTEPPPGLVVIDGGKGQLAVAVQVMEDLGLTGIPLVGMAKSRVKHRGDEIYRTEERFFLPGRKNPVTFKSTSPALYLLQRLRDEAHRFGITYHRELRGRRNLRSLLEEIPGVGKTRASALLRHFGSLRKLKEATAEQIAAVDRMPADLARRIYDRLAAAPPEPEAEPGMEPEAAQPAEEPPPPPAPDDANGTEAT